MKKFEKKIPNNEKDLEGETTFSAPNLIQNLAEALSKASFGNNGLCGHVSSMYSRMTKDSAMGLPR